jgi:hypothetical protein
MQMDVTGYGAGQARRRATLQRTRRFALVGVVAAALALFLATGATFTATNDTVTITPGTANTAPAVFKAGGGALPTGTGAPTTWVTGGTAGTVILPTWVPTLNTVVGQTATVGDVAVVDTRNFTGTVIVTVAFGNAGNLNQAYSYMILPLELRKYDGTSAWVSSAATDSASVTTARYLSLTNGYLQYFMTGGFVYEVVIPAGGSIYTVNADTPANLQPTFVVNVRAG